jgi:hypothetical protein|tara:strand:+ start:463 stop:654 length:192 start_codon:yes stop_codon:yes gene_type:complete
MSKSLKYYQQILQKVSFDECLFSKELRKAYTLLPAGDQVMLQRWVADFVQNRVELQSVVYSHQ